MSVVSGASWIQGNIIESFNRMAEFQFKTLKEVYSSFKEKSILKNEINNFRRISEKSKIYSLLTGLTLFDSISTIDLNKTAIVSCYAEGSLTENIKYFKDYADAGRKMARGNLFVYTLPTSSLGEVAISFKIKGPLFHLTYKDDLLNNFLNHLSFMLESGQTENIIAFFSEREDHLCLILSKNFSCNEGIDFNDLLTKISIDSGINEVVINLKNNKMKN